MVGVRSGLPLGGRIGGFRHGDAEIHRGFCGARVPIWILRLPFPQIVAVGNEYFCSRFLNASDPPSNTEHTFSRMPGLAGLPDVFSSDPLL